MSPSTFAKKTAILATATFTAVFAAGLMWFFLRFLGDTARAAVPFGGHTLPLGTDFVRANRLAVLFLIASGALLAHALARVAQLTFRWRVAAK